ncbi:probable polygalacturonase At1g80170 [Macadamia integrifolia]|uniref:probable polygalacturonase At1g80170 n=1 Tax=Macadamia integrifolia TaxID=60698 RepID=UPI001C527843|nr:probable polygalacturonase At1g80170 [Macadamia integrifolia]
MEASSNLFVIIIMLLFLVGSVQSRPLPDQTLDDQGHDTTHVFSLLNYGAVGDGVTDDTQAFKEAWNQVCNSSLPSPVLHVPSGKTFLLHPLDLEGPCRSANVTVQIMGNMVAPSDPSEWQCDYLEGSYNCPAFLTFQHMNNLYITGSEGITIDGQGHNWWDLSCHQTTLIIRQSSNVHLRNLNIMDGPNMHIFIQASSWIYASNITISAPKSSPNTDGIHIQYSQNVFVSDSIIGTGDDCISIGDATSFINISRISCGPGHGISIGSLGRGGSTAAVENVHVSDVEFSGTSNGVRIKTWQGGKGYARNIMFEKIQFYDVVYPIIIDQHYCDRHFKDSCQNSDEGSAVKVSNVTYNQVYGTSDRPTAIKFDCSETVPCTDIVVNNINIPSTRRGRKTSSYCQNVYGSAHGLVIPRVPCLQYA